MEYKLKVLDKMKKNKRLIITFIVSLLFALPYLFRNELLESHLNNIALTSYTTKNMEKAYFLDEDVSRYLTIEELRKGFSIAPRIEIINESEVFQLVSEVKPIFKIKIELQVGFFAKCITNTIAGAESISNEVYYIWVGLGWIKISENMIGMS